MSKSVYLILLFALMLNSAQCLDLGQFHRYLKRRNTRSTDCDYQKNRFLEALENRELWALKMLDSYGRLPQALLQGNNMDLGTLNQCINDDVKGRYCLGGLILPLDVLTNVTITSEAILMKKFVTPFAIIGGIEGVNLSNVILISACVPDACYPSDFFGPFGHDQFCITRQEATTLNRGDIACLFFFVFVLLLMTASTAYDLYIKTCSKEPTHALLLSFSAYTNGKKIIRVSEQSDQILFFNGLKVISMFWVIVGHRYQIASNIVINKADATEWVRKLYSEYVTMAPLAVDTFFFVSGALLAYTFLKSMNKTNVKKFNLFLFYLHRFLRLTPALAVLFFFQMTLSERLASFPKGLDTMFERCQRNWWSLFLYIQNYVAPLDLCMPHTWYLSVDMQLFIISPLILLPVVLYGKKISCILFPVLIVGVVLGNILIFWFFNILPSDELYNKWSYATHGRIPQWLLGVSFGVFMHDYQGKKERVCTIKRKAVVSIIWALTFGVVAVVFYFFRDVMFNPTSLKSTLYYSLHKVAWCIYLWWLSFACLTGEAGFIANFLSLSVFQVLSKITYCTYLVHLLLISIHAKQLNQLVYFTDYEMIRNSIADIFLAYVFGALCTLAFESPIIALERILFDSGRRKQDRDDATDVHSIPSNSVVSS